MHLDPLDPVDLLSDLIRFDSVSSRSNVAITDFLTQRLAGLGFRSSRCDYVDSDGVAKANLIATRDPVAARSGTVNQSLEHRPVGGPGVAFFCHTDVVPADAWSGPGGAFEPVCEHDRIYGRGSCDMKGAIAAFCVAASTIAQDRQSGPITIVCTADEECSFVGAKHLVARSPEYRLLVDRQPLAIVGEPTTCQIVHAHKGIYSLRITSRGRAAHSSTRDGLNANHAMVPMLAELMRLYEISESDTTLHDPRFDPPTLSWTFGVSDGCEAKNITPAISRAWVSLRPMPDIDGSGLVESARQKASELGLQFEKIPGGGHVWVDPQSPFLQELCELAGCPSPKTVCYGTDGGELTELKRLVICGPGDIAQAHTSDEWISRDQVQRGISVYQRILERWA